MRKIVLFLLIIIASSSCLSVKRIQRNCDEFAAVCITDTEIETEIVYLDKIVYVDRDVPVKLPADTVKIDIPIPCTETINLGPITRENGLVGATAQVVNSRLFVEAYLTDSIYIGHLQDSIRILNAVKQTVVVETNTVTIKEDTNFGKFAKRWFWWSLVILAGAVVIIILKLKKR